MDWKEKLKEYYGRKLPEVEARSSVPDVTPPRAILDPISRSSLESLENNNKRLNTYYEHCIRYRPDGETFETMKYIQEPAHFSDLYSDDKIEADEQTEHRIPTSVGKFYASIAEATLWQLQKDYQIFGADVEIVPTSRFDDKTKGIDLVWLQWNEDDTKNPILIDMASLDDDETFLEAKGTMKFGHGSREGHIRYGGAVRHLEYLRTSHFFGYEEMTGHDGTKDRRNGLDGPAIALGLSKEDLFNIASLVIDSTTGKPRGVDDIQRDARFSKLREALLGKIEDALKKTQMHLENEKHIRESSRRGQEHVPDISKFGAITERTVDELHARVHAA
ncbi:MAG: hypothetical protein AAB855_04190 [Patescibacteria group bacterium]